MINELQIANLAIIDNLHLTFSKGLTVLTGETGAGKSIVLQAINLLAGAKASSSVIKNDAETAIVEALFEIPAKSPVWKQLKDNGLDASGPFIIKRILHKNGRSRYYINGSLATARLTGELTRGLITVAAQREHQQLLIPDRHLDFIDSAGNLWEMRQQFGDLFYKWNELQKRIRELQRKESDKEQRRDFLRFQLNEITDAAFIVGEDEGLTLEKNRLKSSDNLTQLAEESCALLDEHIIDQLAHVRKNLEQIAKLDESMTALADELSDKYYQLEDHASHLRNYCHSIPNDPARLETVDARLDLLKRLKRKYGGSEQTLPEVLAYAEKIQLELHQLSDFDQQLGALHLQLEDVEKRILKEARKLTEHRMKHADILTEKLQQELSSLGFKQAAFEVSFAASDYILKDLNETGWDRPEFMFSANPGVPVKPLANIISGGELSRLMLAFKCILAQKDMVETVLFDEVDSGIGGSAAQAVARKIDELANHHQVFCITHLPQIASYADQHFIVTKEFFHQRTSVSISMLPKEKRAAELARMLAGDAITDKTLRYAEELTSKHQ